MAEFQLSDDQQTALDKVLTWWQGQDKYKEPFVLTGSAGTGKSTIVREILQSLPLIPEKIIMLAPTGTAVKNIQQKNPEIQAQTISSFIERPFTYVNIIDPKTGDIVSSITNVKDLKKSDYIVTDDEKLKFEPQDFGFMRVLSTAVAKHGLYAETAVGFKLKDEDMDMATRIALPQLIVIDELGMVSEDKFEHIRDMGIPIFGLGDPYQLKPVASVQNKIISDTKRTDFYHELTVVHRQDGENPIVAVATSARQGKDWLSDARRLESSSVVVAKYLRDDPDQLGQLIARADMVLSPSNFSVQAFNKMAHDILHPNTKLAVGEKILVTSNTSEKENGSPVLTNGMQGVITELVDTPVVASDLDLQLVKIQTHSQTLTVLANTVHLSDTRTKYSELAKTKSVKLQQILLARARTYLDEGKVFDLGADLDEIIYISYGYAMTVHKSQGKEWQNVVFDTEIPQRMQANAQPLVYTAITRAKENLIFI